MIGEEKSDICRRLFFERAFFRRNFLRNFEKEPSDGTTLFFDRVFRRHHVANDPINFIDPSGLFLNLPGAAIGFISGGIGGYTSGGGWGVVAGSLAGAGVGLVIPTASGAAGAAAGGFASNVIGQILGNGIAGTSLGSVDVGQAIGSGFAGATGALATSALRVGSIAGQAAVCSGVDAGTNAATAPFQTGPVDFCRIATGKPCGL